MVTNIFTWVILLFYDTSASATGCRGSIELVFTIKNSCRKASFNEIRRLGSNIKHLVNKSMN